MPTFWHLSDQDPYFALYVQVSKQYINYSQIVGMQKYLSIIHIDYFQHWQWPNARRRNTSLFSGITKTLIEMRDKKITCIVKACSSKKRQSDIDFFFKLWIFTRNSVTTQRTSCQDQNAPREKKMT